MRQFLLSLVNATLLLTIVLVLLVLWLVYKVEDVAADLVTKVDMRVVDLVEGDIRDAVTEIHGLRHDLGTFNDELAQLVDHPEITLSPEIREELDAIIIQAAQIDMAVTRLTDFDRDLSDRQIREIGKVLSEVVINARGCRTDDAGT
jgi:hypothetical protein